MPSGRHRLILWGWSRDACDGAGGQVSRRPVRPVPRRGPKPPVSVSGRSRTPTAGRGHRLTFAKRPWPG